MTPATERRDTCVWRHNGRYWLYPHDTRAAIFPHDGICPGCKRRIVEQQKEKGE